MNYSYFPTVTNNVLSLPLYVTSVGMSALQTNIVRPNGLKDAQLLFTAQGEGEAVVGGRKYRLPRGSVLFLNPFEAHSYYKLTESWTTYWITYGGTAAKYIFDMKNHLIPSLDELDFIKRTEEIYLCSEGEDWNKKSSTLLYKLLFEIIELKGGLILSAQSQKNRMKAVFDYISAHFAEEIQLSEIADIAGISKEYLCRLFKNQTGMRPFEYITLYRISEAKSILQNRTDLKIYEVGKMVGFSDSSYFNKVFKKYEAITPMQYSGET